MRKLYLSFVLVISSLTFITFTYAIPQAQNNACSTIVGNWKGTWTIFGSPNCTWDVDAAVTMESSGLKFRMHVSHPNHPFLCGKGPGPNIESSSAYCRNGQIGVHLPWGFEGGFFVNSRKMSLSDNFGDNIITLNKK